MNAKAFWKRIKELIKSRNVTQETAARACGLSYGTFRKWMSRKMIPPLNAAYRISRYLGVSLEHLINGPAPERAARTIEEVIIMHKEENDRLNYIRTLIS